MATLLESGMIKFLVVFVAYRKKINEILPLKYFNNLVTDEIEFFIYDNSPDKAELESLSLNHKFQYYHDAGNGGVSKAYNVAAEYALKNQIEWIVLFDQDTEVKKGYFPNLKIAIKENPEVKLFVPKVYYNHGVMSPKRCRFFRPQAGELDYGIHKLNDIAIINSGLVVTTQTFKQCGGYNEDVKLDFSDYQFIERLQSKIDQFYLFKGELFQDFSNDETDSQKLFSRFMIYCEGLKNYQTTPFRRLVIIYTGFLHSLSLMRRTKNSKFITHFIKSLFR